MQPSPDCGVLDTLIEDLTLKITLLLFTLLRARERLKISTILHQDKLLFVFYRIFAEWLIFCTDTHFIHEFSNYIILNRISFVIV